jgi:hypothetical protein
MITINKTLTGSDKMKKNYVSIEESKCIIKRLWNLRNEKTWRDIIILNIEIIREKQIKKWDVWEHNPPFH